MHVQSGLADPGWNHHSQLSWRLDHADTIELAHSFCTADICDDTLVRALCELVTDGVLVGQHEFEEAAVGIIESTAAELDESWNAFYRNTLRTLDDGTAAFAPVHRRALSLIDGSSMLDVGSCFGFLALRCAREGRTVSACDISAGATALLRSAAIRCGVNVDAVVGDATRLPFAENSFDSVTLIHLLEHLDKKQILIAIGEALRVARRRVVIAVPFEDVPSAHFGHTMALTVDDLVAWSRCVDHNGATTAIDHGGWLVLQPRT